MSAYDQYSQNDDHGFWATPVLTRDSGELWCPGFEGNTYASSPWDYVRIMIPVAAKRIAGPGWITPGKAEIKITKKRKTDKKSSSGSDGGRVTVLGLEQAEIEIALTIWTPEQWRVLRELWPILFPLSNKPPKGSSPGAKYPSRFTVQNPTLALHGVTGMVFTHSTGPEPHSVSRAKIFTMHALETLVDTGRKATTTPQTEKDPGSLYDKSATDVARPSADHHNTDP